MPPELATYLAEPAELEVSLLADAFGADDVSIAEPRSPSSDISTDQFGFHHLIVLGLVLHVTESGSPTSVTRSSIESSVSAGAATVSSLEDDVIARSGLVG